MNIKIILSNTLMILAMFIILVFLLNSSYIYNFIWSTDNLFQDLIMPVKWLECFKDGFDIFNSDVCAGGTFAYGPMFLNLPINETLKIFYLEYLPYLSIFLLTTFVVISINKNTLSHKEVIDAALKSKTKLIKILSGIIKGIRE